MKKNAFTMALFVCILTGFLSNIGLFAGIFYADEMLYSGFSTAFMKLGNQVSDGLVPGVAAGIAILLAVHKLKLWQACTLCMSIPLFHALFQNLFIPLVSMAVKPEEALSVSLPAAVLSYVMNESNSFPVFFLGLFVCGILEKDRLVAALCTAWNIGWYGILNLLPPFFPQFDFNTMQMDKGELTRRALLYGLSYLAVGVLIFLVIYDLAKDAKREKNTIICKNG